MKKGITKLLISFAAALLTVVPFSYHINAEYTYDYNSVFAYHFWSMYGFDTISPDTNISGSIGSYSITGSFNLIESTTGSESIYSVYSTNGTWLGYYKSSSGQNIYYINSSGQTSTCSGCYIGLDLNPGDFYSNNVTLNVPNESISIIESGSPYIPYLTTNGNVFPTVSAYQSTKNVYIGMDISNNSDNAFVISFITNKQISAANMPIMLGRNGDTTYTTTREYVVNMGSASSNYLCIHTYSFKLNGTWANNNTSISFPALEGLTDVKILPIYVGYKSALTEDMGKMIGIDVGIDHLIEDGNSESQASEQANDTQNTQLNTSITNLTSQEDAFLDDMDDSLNDITWSSSLLGNSSLALSANWVKVQYERMTQNNVIGDIIQYAMLFGLGLLIVGKMR